MTRLMLLFLGTVAVADEYPGIEKYRDYTPEQLAAVPQEVRSAEVPMIYLYAAQIGLAEGKETIFAMYLNQLMYPGVHDYDRAVRQFQRDLGHRPDGELTVWQIATLEKRAEMQKLSSIIFPDDFYSYIDEDYASISGTWVILEDQIAYPINHTKIKCWRGKGYCEMDQLMLMTPDRDRWEEYFSVNQFDTEYYDITRWTEDSIDAVPQGSAAHCRTVTLNFNFSTKEFYEISRNTGTECEFLGETMPPLEKPRISQVVDGKEIMNSEFNKHQKAAFKVLASDFRAEIDRLIEAQKGRAE